MKNNSSLKFEYLLLHRRYTTLRRCLMKMSKVAALVATIETATPEEKAALIAALGLNQPVQVTRTVNRYSQTYKRTDKVIDAKMAKQMRQCIESLTEIMDLETWGKKAVEHGLTTQQDPKRIVAYYRKAMLDGGYVEEVK